MIIKSKSYTKSDAVFSRVVKYIMRESEQENSFVLTRFIKGKNKSAEEISRQFLENEQKHRINPRKNNVKLYMEIISFHKENTKDLTNEKLKRIARHYLRLRSKHSIAVVTVHRKEKDHVHLHVLLSGIEYKVGRSIRISKDDFKNKVKLPMERFQERFHPDLERSKINHDKVLEKVKKKST